MAILCSDINGFHTMTYLAFPIDYILSLLILEFVVHYVHEYYIKSGFLLRRRLLAAGRYTHGIWPLSFALQHIKA